MRVEFSVTLFSRARVLARVEVLRGPQWTLYGASSMGGLIKFVTVDPSTEDFSGRIQAGTSAIHNGTEPGYSVRGSINVSVTEGSRFGQVPSVAKIPATSTIRSSMLMASTRPWLMGAVSRFCGNRATRFL
jgi:hypothetical protein